MIKIKDKLNKMIARNSMMRIKRLDTPMIHLPISIFAIMYFASSHKDLKVKKQLKKNRHSSLPLKLM